MVKSKSIKSTKSNKSAKSNGSNKSKGKVVKEKELLKLVNQRSSGSQKKISETAPKVAVKVERVSSAKSVEKKSSSKGKVIKSKPE